MDKIQNLIIFEFTLCRWREESLVHLQVPPLCGCSPEWEPPLGSICVLLLSKSCERESLALEHPCIRSWTFPNNQKTGRSSSTALSLPSVLLPHAWKQLQCWLEESWNSHTWKIITTWASEYLWTLLSLIQKDTA